MLLPNWDESSLAWQLIRTARKQPKRKFYILIVNLCVCKYAYIYIYTYICYIHTYMFMHVYVIYIYIYSNFVATTMMVTRSAKQRPLAVWKPSPAIKEVTKTYCTFGWRWSRTLLSWWTLQLSLQWLSCSMPQLCHFLWTSSSFRSMSNSCRRNVEQWKDEWMQIYQGLPAKIRKNCQQSSVSKPRNAEIKIF